MVMAPSDWAWPQPLPLLTGRTEALLTRRATASEIDSYGIFL